MPLHIAESESEHDSAIEHVCVIAGHVPQPVQIAAVSHQSVELDENVMRLVVVHVLVLGAPSWSYRVLAPPARQEMRPLDPDEIAML
jgi:hypothetical protein